ncbi:MAG: hypothetical protein AAF533_18455 [Acidobacteriota bacterium]
MNDLDHVFHQHAPPPGGLDALRERLRSERRALAARRRRRVVGLALAPVALVLIVLVPRLREPAPDPAWLAARDHAVQLTTNPTPLRLSDDQRAHAAVLRVPLPDDDVVFYWVSKLDDGGGATGE